MGHHPKKRPDLVKQTTKEKLNKKKKERKLKLKEKRARLVVHNLPFQVTEEKLIEYFQKYGEIDHIKILKKEDSKLVGCAFIQFKLVQKAAKAKHHTNGQPFMGRNISVDFALAKNKYEQQAQMAKVKEEIEEKIKIKDEPVDLDLINSETVEIKDDTEEKQEVESVDEEKIEIQSVDKVEEGIEKDNISDEDDFKSDDDDSKSDDDEIDNSDEEVVKTEDKKPRVESNDVTEGRTVFIKNVPFSATNDDLKECMKQFGPIFYALICIDKFTEHSKGTAFVKFVNVEDAQKALSAGTELTLLGNILDCHPALGKNQVQQKSMLKKEQKAPKDSRNLYLVKEGVILAGSKAAEGVSGADMAKRLQIEQYKTQMLRNLNMFISPNRLIIHNLPATWNDEKLYALIKKHSPKTATIKETKIMRDLKNIDSTGQGVSKEFGFVTFTKHEDALAVLRSLNNNPNIFSEKKRPIVAFSIENKAMIKAKLKRLEKSKLKNPKCKQFDPKVVQDDQKKIVENNQKFVNTEKYAGVVAKPGIQKMRSRYNLKTQAQLHHENLKKEKKKLKNVKKSFEEKKKDFIKQDKQKIVRKHEDDGFSKMVSEYKQKLLNGAPVVKKAKWYE